MVYLKQCNEDDIGKEKIDLFVGSSGFESRATLQAEKFMNLFSNKIILGFDNEINDPIRKKNDIFFKENSFEIFQANVEESNNSCLDGIFELIKDLTKSKDEVIVYIDYSCMTKNWYSYLLYGIFNFENNNKIRIFLGYSHAEFVPYNDKSTLNRIVSPLFGYCDLSVPSRPTALIIGMGNEPNRIHGLKEYFDAVPYLFYSDKNYNQEYSSEVEYLNKEVIDEISADNVFKFPVNDMIYTNQILENLCLALLEDYRVIIAPCGPKPFAILAMINSLKHDDSLEVWRISPGVKVPVIDRRPTGLISILELSFS